MYLDTEISSQFIWLVSFYVNSLLHPPTPAPCPSQGLPSSVSWKALPLGSYIRSRRPQNQCKFKPFLKLITATCGFTNLPFGPAKFLLLRQSQGCLRGFFFVHLFQWVPPRSEESQVSLPRRV